MSLSTMTPTGELPIPTRGGVTSPETLARIEVLEQELADLKQSIASDTAYGLSKVTNAADVTQENGIALSAMQNNSSLEGTLANKIEKLNNSNNKLEKKFNQTLIDGFINIDILTYAENVAGKGLQYAYTASIEETNVPQTYYSYANTIILKSGIGGRITVIIFDRYSGGRFTMNSKYNNENWSGWKEISVL